MSKPIDYDAPRRPVVEMDDNVLHELTDRTAAGQSGRAELDDAQAPERFDLPDADPSGEDMTVSVVPMQSDEFRCERCFLVHHRSQLAARPDGQELCPECS